MGSRLELHTLLISTFNGINSKNIYFQPPQNLAISYPCIVYSLDSIANTHADNNIYAQNKFYKIIVIDENPDSNLVTTLSMMKTASFVTRYISDNLYHTVFKIQY